MSISDKPALLIYHTQSGLQLHPRYPLCRHKRSAYKVLTWNRHFACGKHPESVSICQERMSCEKRWKHTWTRWCSGPMWPQGEMMWNVAMGILGRTWKPASPTNVNGFAQNWHDDAPVVGCQSPSASQSASPTHQSRVKDRRIKPEKGGEGEG